MSTKGRYQVRNWKEYNKSLIQRGNITVWFSDDAIEKWLATKEEGKIGLFERCYSCGVDDPFCISPPFKSSSGIFDLSRCIDGSTSPYSLLYSNLQESQIFRARAL